MGTVYDEVFAQTAISQPLGNQGYSLGVGTELQNYYTLLYWKLSPTDELIVTWNLTQQLTDQSTLPTPGESPNGTIGYLTRYENWPINQRPQFYDPVLSVEGPIICVTPTPTPTQTPTPSLCGPNPYQIFLTFSTNTTGAFTSDLNLACSALSCLSSSSCFGAGAISGWFNSTSPQVGDSIYSSCSSVIPSSVNGFYIVNVNSVYTLYEFSNGVIVSTPTCP
jgi:hypothetical protein